MTQKKPYNPNTAYGRKKLREQAQYNYDNGTPEYRQEIDNIGCFVWAIVILICIIIGFFIFQIGGEKALMKWLK